MANQLVLAFFENEAFADAAVNNVKLWDKASSDIKLGAIGILVKDDKGKIKTHKLGGEAETHAVSDEAVQEATVAAETAPEEPAV